MSWAIDTFGSNEQRQQYLPRLTTMDMLGAYCLTEPGSGSDAASLKTVAHRDGSDYRLTGGVTVLSVCRYVCFLSFAQEMLALCNTLDPTVDSHGFHTAARSEHR